MAAMGRLPGVGPKTALRYVFALLHLKRDELELVSRAIDNLKRVSVCGQCFTYAEANICDICADGTRTKETICVVAEARDISTIEATGMYKGKYFVLGGVLNPIDGYTPDKLHVKELSERLKADTALQEVILAFSSDVHGETTIMYLSRLMKAFNKKVTRLARGLPMGADIEYADEVTLASALSGRSET
jgi:recombination protein RecR